MKRTTKTIMAFLTAMTMTAGAMGVTAYAEEIKQPAQIAQTAFSHYIDYFCFLRCLLDRGRVTSVGAFVLYVR